MNSKEGQTPAFDVVWDEVLKNLDDNNDLLFENCPAPLKRFVQDHVLFNCPCLCKSATPSEYQFVIGKPEDKQIIFLGYELIGDITANFHTGPAFELSTSPVWLYDEFHKVDNHYEHHVVFSDGTELILPFIFFHFRTTSWFEG
jgi:hypothetical protein